MITFRGDTLTGFGIPQATAWLIADIAEAKGRQDLFTRRAPQVLRALREMALIESVESSNRIEGVTVAPGRLRPLVLGKATPRDRSEQDVQGYRRALSRIHSGAGSMVVSPELFLDLHSTIQLASGDAGAWKTVDNEIVELRPGLPPLVRFRPLSARDTPDAVAELCRAYRHVLDQRLVQPLVATAALVLDFLCPPLPRRKRARLASHHPDRALPAGHRGRAVHQP